MKGAFLLLGLSMAFTAPNTSLAQDNERCGQNRRCRLEELRVREIWRRRQRARTAHSLHSWLHTRREQLESERNPRSLHPWFFALTGNEFGPGVQMGYTFAGKLRVSAVGGYANYYLSNEFNDPVDFEGGVIGVEATYFLFENGVSPFVSGGLFSHLGSSYTYDYSPGVGAFSEDLHVNNDFLQGTVGLAVHVDAGQAGGFYTSLGLSLRWLFYSRAQNSGRYSSEVRKTFEDEWPTFGAEGAIGWCL